MANSLQSKRGKYEAAAKAKVAIDKRLGRVTPLWIRQLADGTKVIAADPDEPLDPSPRPLRLEDPS